MMYPAKPGLIIGFHGCDISTRNAVVLNETNLTASTNDYDWLGHGIYFWESNQQRAIQFAGELQKQIRKNKPQISRPAVLGAVIDMGFCLDLMDSEHLQLVRSSYENVLLIYKNSGAKIPENKYAQNSNERLIRKLDCEVIENLHKLRTKCCQKPFDSVRSIFVEGKELGS